MGVVVGHAFVDGLTDIGAGEDCFIVNGQRIGQTRLTRAISVSSILFNNLYFINQDRRFAPRL